MHALVAARLGDAAMALHYLRATAASDLDFDPNSAGGVRIAGLGALWQAVILGFAGLDLKGDMLGVDPRLPPQWRSRTQVMSRWPYGGRATCESCKSLDVRHLHRRGRLSAAQTFSWAWACAGEPSGSIKVRTEQDTVTLIYRTRHLLAADWKAVEQRVPVTWTHVTLAVSAHGLSAPPGSTADIAAGGSPCCTSLAKCSRAESVMRWPMPASRAACCFVTSAGPRALGCG
jgi:hypothetical protein